MQYNSEKKEWKLTMQPKYRLLAGHKLRKVDEPGWNISVFIGFLFQ